MKFSFRIMTNKLMSLFNLAGNKNKQSFRATNLFKVILGMLSSLFIHFDVSKMKISAKVFLVYNKFKFEYF